MKMDLAHVHRTPCLIYIAEVTDCWWCPNDCFQFTEEYTFAKNVSARVKCSQCCCCCDSKVNTTEGWRCSTCHSRRNFKAKEKKSGSKVNFSAISVIFVVVSLKRSHFKQQLFWFLLSSHTQLVLTSPLRCPWNTHVDVTPHLVSG